MQKKLKLAVDASSAKDKDANDAHYSPQEVLSRGDKQINKRIEEGGLEDGGPEVG